MLVKAVESALQQTRPPDEIIVVDDGSTDDTEQVIARYGGKLRYIRQENSGPAAARNNGIRRATSDFIAFLDSDDLWTPEKIDTQLAFFSRNPEVDFIFANMTNFRGNAKMGLPEIKNHEVYNYLICNASDLKDLFGWLMVENVVPTPTVMAKREAIQRVGFFKENLRVAEDLDYWLRAAEMCRWGFINEVLLLRRRHESNLIADSMKRNAVTLEVLDEATKRLIAPAPRLLGLIRENIDQIRYDLGSVYLRSREFSAARKCFSQIHARGNRRFMISLKNFVAMILEVTGAIPRKNERRVRNIC